MRARATLSSPTTVSCPCDDLLGLGERGFDRADASRGHVEVDEKKVVLRGQLRLDGTATGIGPSSSMARRSFLAVSSASMERAGAAASSSRFFAFGQALRALRSAGDPVRFARSGLVDLDTEGAPSPRSPRRARSEARASLPPPVRARPGGRVLQMWPVQQLTQSEAFVADPVQLAAEMIGRQRRLAAR